MTHVKTNRDQIDQSPMIKIRKATARDANAIARVHVDTWRDTYAGIIPDRILLRMSHRRHGIARAVELGTRRNRHP